MSVLVDSSAWIAYLRGDGDPEPFESLIDEDLLVVNDLILTELVPFLEVRRERKLIEILRLVRRLPLEIDWNGLVRMQIVCLRNGINKVGIPDLIIAQQAIENDMALLSLDKHFRLMSKHLSLSLY